MLKFPFKSCIIRSELFSGKYGINTSGNFLLKQRDRQITLFGQISGITKKIKKNPKCYKFLIEPNVMHIGSPVILAICFVGRATCPVCGATLLAWEEGKFSWQAGTNRQTLSLNLGKLKFMSFFLLLPLL